MTFLKPYERFYLFLKFIIMFLFYQILFSIHFLDYGFIKY